MCVQVFGRSQSMPGTETMLTKPVEKQHTDTVVNFLIRIACQVGHNCFQLSYVEVGCTWLHICTHTHSLLMSFDLMAWLKCLK